MKYFVMLGDGMADRPIPELSGKTPLSAANKPNMDYISKNGELGLTNTLFEGIIFCFWNLKLHFKIFSFNQNIIF